MYSCRAELDAEMEKVHIAIERVKIEYRDEEVLDQGAKAQSLLPLLESLYDDEKFHSVEDLEKKIDELTVRMGSIDVIQDRIPLVQAVKRLTALVEQNGVILEDKKLAGNKGGPVQGSESCVPCVGVFYDKLVYPEDIDIQLHELSFLVSNLNQLKVFYSYLNHLRRSKSLHDEDWQRYSSIALHQTSRKMSVSDSASIEMFERIVSQFRKDGIFVNENIMRSIGINSTSSDVEAKLEPYEFRVGQILPLETPKPVKTASDYPVLMHVQALGRSLKELGAAYEARDENNVAVAVICSILNALSFGGPGTLHSWVKPSSVISVLDQIVDYGNVDHICSVVNQSDNEALQQVCKEGLDIVERARSNETNDDASAEDNSARTQFLVSAMGLLANGVTKLVRETTRVGSDGESEDHVAVTILALIVTAKMIQMVEPAVESESPNTESIDESKTHVKGTFGAGFQSTNVSSAAFGPSIVDPLSRSAISSQGRGRTLLQRVVAIEESISQDNKSEHISEKEIRAMAQAAVDHCMSQKQNPLRLAEMMEKLDNRLSTLEEFLDIRGVLNDHCWNLCVCIQNTVVQRLAESPETRIISSVSLLILRSPTFCSFITVLFSSPCFVC